MTRSTCKVKRQRRRLEKKHCLTKNKFQDNICFLNIEVVICGLIDPGQPVKPATRVIDLTEFNKYVFLKLFLFNYMITNVMACTASNVGSGP